MNIDQTNQDYKIGLALTELAEELQKTDQYNQNPKNAHKGTAHNGITIYF